MEHSIQTWIKPIKTEVVISEGNENVIRFGYFIWSSHCCCGEHSFPKLVEIEPEGNFHIIFCLVFIFQLVAVLNQCYQ